MDSENEVALEEEKRVIGVTDKKDINKEDANACGEEIHNENEASKVESHISSNDIVESENSVARVPMLLKRIRLLEPESTITRIDCLWLFALCAAVDTPLDADTCAALRSLLRKCADIRAEKDLSKGHNFYNFDQYWSSIIQPQELNSLAFTEHNFS